MGSQISKNKEKILYYYIFQKKINNYINSNKIQENEKKKLKIGYIINPDWIKEWKARINYNKIESDYLDHFNLDSTKLNKQQKLLINQFIEKNNDIDNLDLDIKTIVKNNYFKFFIYEKMINKVYLENFVNKKTFNKLVMNDKTTYEKVKYIFKKKMFMLFIEKYLKIKILLYSTNFKNNHLVTLTYIFYDQDTYNTYSKIFENYESDAMIENLRKTKIFKNKIRFGKEKNKVIFEIKNENFEEVLNIGNKNNEDKSIENNEMNIEIRDPNEINFNLINRICYKGLDNVGATCYMNATLQCLANIKPITDYLLSQKNYNFLYQNNDICKMTLQYIQVLIGLFCSESIKGSYCPENFKKAISELNPLFQGVQANDSKDLIIFLLEIMNNELVKIHNKKYNINNNGDELYQKIDASNEYLVLNYFLENFKKNYCTIIGNYLIGFNKSVFICQNCNGKTINFNIFNLLIFSLEATSNYYNLGKNNNSIPVINFNHCFGFLSKEEIFQDTYCQKCGKTGFSTYKETIYSFPLYLIIILNRGKGNIFNCHVQIPEKFNPSNYVEKNTQNDEYELIGIVSHFGESGMGGHFIAFCKHSIDGKWRCYNDSIVTECSNDYLNKGTPYILFYKKCPIENKNNQQSNISFNNSQIPNQNNYNQSRKYSITMNNINSQFDLNQFNPQFNYNYNNNINNSILNNNIQQNYNW